MSKLHRLRAAAHRHVSKPRVDRTFPGRINGLSIATKGEAKGHGFDLDQTSLEQIAEHAPGAKGRWTHGNLCADGLGKHLGQVDPESVELHGDHVVGDFVFSKRAHDFKPEGLTVSAAQYLMDMADEEPDALGLSIVFTGEPEEAEDTVTGLAARVESVPRVDWVADPAANPEGLFAGTGSELSALATLRVDEFVEAVGLERAASFAITYLKEKDVDFSALDLEKNEQTGLAELTELRGQLVALTAERDALAQKVETFLAADAERRTAEVDTYMERLAAKSAELQQPIAAAELGGVRELFELGQDETARKLGEALLRTAELSANASEFERAKGDARPGPTSAQLEANHLRAAGWTVQLSEDRTEILSAKPGQE